LAEDLRRYQDGKPILARPTPTWERAWKWCCRRPTTATVLAACVLAALSASVGGVLYARNEEQRAATAELLRREADAERQRAQRHFLRARAAVEQMLLRVGEERLAYEPRMERIRRDLLEQAVGFYEQFLREEGQSPAVRHEAAL